jgi:hypothetical protein
MRIRKVLLKEMVSASPRTSVPLFFESSIVRNVSRWVWILNVDGLSGTGIMAKDSSGEIAVELAERMPYLSQPRYLFYGSVPYISGIH